MSNSILISYPGETPDGIKLVYSIEQSENLQTINCMVDEKHFPFWLQMRKFSLLSLKDKNSYTPLFNEVNNSKNVATSLFIDMAYKLIMAAEKMVVKGASN
jgi:hypothetical protein